MAKEGSLKDIVSDACLTYSEIASRVQMNISTLWRIAPSHGWYECDHPGAALIRTGNRCIQTALARFRSGHLRTLRHVSGLKVFPPCPKCNSTQANPLHILTCIDCHKCQLFSCPVKFVNVLTQHGFMDLI